MKPAMHDPGFDPITYWRDRHVRHKGSVCSVGHLGKSLEQNIEGTRTILAFLRSMVAELYPARTGLKALDLACGIGRCAPLLAESGFDYTGVDISTVALEQAAAACPTGRFIEADVTTYVPTEQYDLVLSLFFFAHVIDDNRWHATLGAIARSLKSNGYCLLMDYMPPVDRYEPAKHVVERSRVEYDAALAHVGLMMRNTTLPEAFLIVPSGAARV